VAGIIGAVLLAAAVVLAATADPPPTTGTGAAGPTDLREHRIVRDGTPP
jgi:hypothetical protein